MNLAGQPLTDPIDCLLSSLPSNAGTVLMHADRQVPPRRRGTQHPKDAAEETVVVHPWRHWILRELRIRIDALRLGKMKFRIPEIVLGISTRRFMLFADCRRSPNITGSYLDYKFGGR
jgi:hypothetical protein